MLPQPAQHTIGRASGSPFQLWTAGCDAHEQAEAHMNRQPFRVSNNGKNLYRASAYCIAFRK
jgi:hypothetical protein